MIFFSQLQNQHMNEIILLFVNQMDVDDSTYIYFYNQSLSQVLHSIHHSVVVSSVTKN